MIVFFHFCETVNFDQPYQKLKPVDQLYEKLTEYLSTSMEAAVLLHGIVGSFSINDGNGNDNDNAIN